MKLLMTLLTFGVVTTMATAQAQSSYPSRPVTLVVAGAAGGGLDAAARFVGRKMSEVLHQSIVIENKPGMGEAVAIGAVARANPDGYTLLICSNGITVSPNLYNNLPYDVKDLRPIARVGVTPLVLVAHASEPYSNLAELIAFAKANPTKLSFGSPGTGTPHHMSVELIKSKTGAPIQHIPYRGAAPAMNDLLAGIIPLLPASTLVAEPNIQAGRVKALVMINSTRWPTLPNVPTLTEALPGVDVKSWMAIFAPAGISKPIEATLSHALKIVLNDPEVIGQMTRLGTMPRWLSPDDLAATIEKDTARWAEVIKQAGIKGE